MKRYSLKHGRMAEKEGEMAFEDIRPYIFPRLSVRKNPAVYAKEEMADENSLLDLKRKSRILTGVSDSMFRDFELTCVIDMSRQFPQMPVVREITDQQLERWKLTREEICKIAMENLEKSRIHIRPVMKNHVPWDDVLEDSIPGVTIYQLSFDTEILESSALNILLFEKQFREIEKMLERPFYLILCEPFPLLIPYAPLDRELDFERVYGAISRSTYAPRKLVSSGVYLFEHGVLRKTGKTVRFSQEEPSAMNF